MIENETANKIPIVLATDNNGIPLLSVTIISILENKHNSTFYDFYILCSNNVSNNSKKKLNEIFHQYPNTKWNYIYMENIFDSLIQMIDHIPQPTYYRLKMADLLPKYYNKAIYLDIDTIILEDLSEYYNINLDNYYIAGVKAYAYINDTDINTKKYYDSIGLFDISSYINAGVTLWNLKKIRDNSMTPKLCELALHNYKSQDQDVINLAFYNHIKCLSFKYNFMTKYLEKSYKCRLDNFKLQECVEESIETPIIIHYADKKKPWYFVNSAFANIWWKYAKQSPFIINFVVSYIYNKLLEIFSVKFIRNHIVISILGIKIKLRKRKRK